MNSISWWEEILNHMTALLSLHYLPCIEYFACFVKYDKILLEASENYTKQSYRNRCLIKSSQRIDILSVPVCKDGRHIPIKEVRIDYSQGWVKDHWRGIQSAYGKSPYFEHYVDLFENVFKKSPTSLFDLNYELLTLCLDLLQIDAAMSFTVEYQQSTPNDVLDYRMRIHHKNSYQNNDILRQCIYPQVFGSNFAENLSIIYLLFCEGPNSSHILNQTTFQ